MTDSDSKQGTPARRILPSVLALCMAVLAAGFVAQAAEPEAEAVRGAMRQIAAPLSVALPLSLSEERFADPANRDVLTAALADLAQSAALLEEHGKQREASFTFLSRALARDAAEANRRFLSGRLEESRFLLGAMADNCIGCHARLPSPGNSDLGRTLFQSVDLAELDPFEQVRLQLMTRQFESALAGCERLLASREYSPEELDVTGVPEVLLLLAARIERAPERALKALDAFAERPDMPIYLRENVLLWSADLAEIAAQPEPTDLLAAARSAVESAQAKTRYPGDRSGAVYELQAGSLLHRGLEPRAGEEPLPASQRAEGYYLLGLVEMRRTESFWPSEADFYLEQAIRTAPGTTLARRAYAVLEEEYTAGGTLDLPGDLGLWLSELRALAVGSSDRRV